MVSVFGLAGGLLALSLVEPELVSSCYPRIDQSKREDVLLFKPGSFACSIQNPMTRLTAAFSFLGLAAVAAVARKSASSYLRRELDKFS